MARRRSAWAQWAAVLLILAAAGAWWWYRSERGAGQLGAGGASGPARADRPAAEEIDEGARADLQRILKERGATGAE